MYVCINVSDQTSKLNSTIYNKIAETPDSSVIYVWLTTIVNAGTKDNGSRLPYHVDAMLPWVQDASV